MKYKRLEFPDVILCESLTYEDERGHFRETFRNDKLNEFLGYSINFCQFNESKSNFGVLRGLHYQLPPYAQTKLVRVVTGNILDVILDLRKHSPTFGKHMAIELSSEHNNHILIPKGFAHGFVVLSDYCIINYQVDNYYNLKYDRGIAYDDNDLKINWRLKQHEIKISERDNNNPQFKNAEYFID